MRNTPWKVDRLTGSIGAQVSELDVRRVGPADADVLRDLVREHGVLFLRGQPTDPAALVDFAGVFGDVLPAHPLKPGLPDHPEVLANQTGGVRPQDVRCRDAHNRHGTNWHVDCTFVREVPTYSLLQAAQVPPVGGDTLFADLAGAYAALSAPLRALADGLSCPHEVQLLYADWLAPDADPHLREKLLEMPVVSQPLVAVDEEAGGRRSLVLNPNCVRVIEGLSGLESHSLLELFLQYTLVPERTVRWRWSEGDIAVWDNVRLLHNYALDHGAAPRLIHRAMAGSTALQPVRSATRETSPSLALSSDR
ncbi:MULTISPECIES: TauD/TfdA family dioxygenase [Streptomyces]|jgi:taurine dioxygenase|uniref:Taurine dioxygenase n=1 Tax=Streptomyces griseoaurantiacus TaxID=68213 RepID=A0A1G7URS4_9ACTN|nr:TauD/TfdA family dioxygenase [Streptomyces jietaisiensis]SDG50214.1 taurine dioxygenase [Streptomyces jietaisiensis]